MCPYASIDWGKEGILKVKPKGGRVSEQAPQTLNLSVFQN